MATFNQQEADIGVVSSYEVGNKSPLVKPHPKRAWWKEASVYQIYPASFKDSNGDGVGDIPGIISKLDYIKKTGVDLVWLCPAYKSPQVDMGYDISDYREIHEQYGTVEDVETLIEGLHSRGIKFLMDLVVNHTSDQHEWFQSAKSSQKSEFRDYYIWRKPKYDLHGNRQPPNNWVSYFGGSAWEYNEPSDEYYLHLFAKEQPDLNWENPLVERAVHEIMRFWLDKGVDGFRMDVINFISKDPNLPDAKITIPSSVYQYGDEFYAAGPHLHKYLKAMGDILKEYNAFSVGEMPAVSDVQELIKVVGEDRGELNMIFHFEIVNLDHGPEGKFTPAKLQMADLKSIVKKWQTFMIENHGWNALYLENHDQSRSVSRFASDSPEHWAHSAKMLATFFALQSGTVFLYQGQELGMTNIPRNWSIEEYRDLDCLNHWEELIKKFPNDTKLQKETMEQYALKSRDNARLPFQWDASDHGGFTTGKPWQRVNDNYKAVNAAAQVDAPGSIFSYWQDILRLRKTHRDVFIYGDFELLAIDNDDVFAYLRTYEEENAVVICNMREKDVTFALPASLKSQDAAVLIANFETSQINEGSVQLRPFEALVLLFKTN